MTQKQSYNPKMFIKCKFSNAVHRIIEPTPIKASSWMKQWEREKKYEKMTDKQKAEMLDKIMEAYNDCSIELTSYLKNKRDKKKIQKLREQKKQSQTELKPAE